MLTRNRTRYFVATALLTLLAACAAWQKPQSFEQQLAYAYSTYTAVVDAAANAVTAGTLSVDDARQVRQLAAEARTLLDAARVASGVGNVTTAEGQLVLATNILTQLRDYLNTRSRK